ncbi:MAG: DUF1428 domain-containing protein [Phycisphaerales bacterium]|nr:DUF1428 domain-containing protein [Phycisphaerales bacterium]
MAYYVDGFVLAVAKKNLPAYKKIAKQAAKVFIEHGAIEYCECLQDDLDVSFGLPFPKLMKTKADEVIIFSWIVYETKAHRNRVGKLVMKDPRMAAMCDPNNMPFDMKRMAWGGFKTIVEAQA